MKKIIQSVFSFSLVVLISACGSQPAAESHDDHAHTPTEGQEANASTAVIKNDKLNAVYQHYVHLTQALTDGNHAEAQVAAAAIELGAQEVAGGAQLAGSAAAISKAGDLDAARQEFSVLSNELITLIKKEGLSAGELYVDYCPMALNDKGAFWISSHKEIKNPYFGASMLTCGEIKETI
jgi:hypothetical protein